VVRESRITENKSRDINRNLITTNHHHHLTTAPTIITEIIPRRCQIRTLPSPPQLLTTSKNKQTKKPNYRMSSKITTTTETKLNEHKKKTERTKIETQQNQLKQRSQVNTGVTAKLILFLFFVTCF
jgi:hypothetical protein